MKQLNVRFENSVFSDIDKLSEKTTCSKSDVARAAMQMGLKRFMEMDDKKLNGLIHLSKIRAMFSNDEDMINEILEQEFNRK